MTTFNCATCGIPLTLFEIEREVKNCYDCENPPTIEQELTSTLCNLLEWAKGNRGSKSGNPYLVPEVKSALQLLAKIQGIENYLDAKTSE